MAWLTALDTKTLTKLADCESNTNPNAINKSDGGSPSYGLFQWKIDSFYYYNIKYRIIPDLDKSDVRAVIMIPEFQIALTKAVLTEPKGWRNWYNCLK